MRGRGNAEKDNDGKEEKTAGFGGKECFRKIEIKSER